jgi:nucleoside-diphosphate-sugar epimerase
MSTRFTVFGTRGFIGSRMVDHLRAQGHDVQVPTRPRIGVSCAKGPTPTSCSSTRRPYS